MINLSNISLQYGDRVIFNQVNLVIKNNDRIGLVGRNGAGKSTLLKMIAGDVSPDSGKINLPGKKTIGFLHQDLKIPKGKTIIQEALTAFEEVQNIGQRIEQINEEISSRDDYQSDSYTNLLISLSELTDRFDHLGGHTMKADAERVLAGLGFKPKDMDRLIDEFSGGWQMRVELTKILLRRPDYILLDEPTNHLDIESIIWLEGFLKSYEGAVVIISHDIMFLDALTKRTIEIELGNIYEYKVNYSKFKILQADRREKMKAAHRNQQREIEHKQKLVDKFRAKKNKAKFAQTLIRQLDKMERIEIEDEAKATMKVQFPPAPRSGQIVVEVKNMTKHFGDVQVLNEVDFQLERGGRIAFVGQNGQGKTTLSKLIAGMHQVTSGDCETGYNVEIGFYAQDQAESLTTELTVLETLEEFSPPEMQTRLRSILGSFLFSGEDVDKRVSVLSGGERARVALACLLLRPVNLLILDEPTNHLDMYSKEVLKQALLKFDGSLIVVSHDREFLTGLTDRTLEFRDHQLIEYLGDVQYFLEQRKLDNMRQVEMSSKSSKEASSEMAGSTTSSYEERRMVNKNKARLERRIKKAEEVIEAYEGTLKVMQEEMSRPSFYQFNKAPQKIEEYQDTKTKLEEAMREWESAHEAFEQFLAANPNLEAR